MDGIGCCHDNWSPIVIDMSDRRPTMTGPEVRFDLANNGVPWLLGWTAMGTDAGFLALDRNGDGRITRGAELFGNFTAQQPGPNRNGFRALGEYDKVWHGGTDDGRIDASDEVYGSLLLWFDRNHDGVSQPFELVSLATAGLSAIELHYAESRYRDQFGNEFKYVSRVWLQGGRRGLAWDIFLVAGRRSR